KKFFMVLLLASLASTSLAILDGDGWLLLTMRSHSAPYSLYLPGSSCPGHPSSHPKKDHVSNEDLSKESFISKEELVSKENAVKRTKSQKPMPQEDNFKNVKLQLEETTELAPRAATTSEGKLAKLSHKVRKNLDKASKGIMNYLKNLIPSANDVTRP
uniref:Glycosylation-dependent cell adhesion molecule 1 n=1 Tax=Piliocolobus tephrosceles TaxID=591936 RepID=A0A8C9IIS4_9PRIM